MWDNVISVSHERRYNYTTAQVVWKIRASKKLVIDGPRASDFSFLVLEGAKALEESLFFFLSSMVLRFFFLKLPLRLESYDIFEISSTFYQNLWCFRPMLIWSFSEGLWKLEVDSWSLMLFQGTKSHWNSCVYSDWPVSLHGSHLEGKYVKHSPLPLPWNTDW